MKKGTVVMVSPAPMMKMLTFQNMALTTANSCLCTACARQSATSDSDWSRWAIVSTSTGSCSCATEQRGLESEMVGAGRPSPPWHPCSTSTMRGEGGVGTDWSS